MFYSRLSRPRARLLAGTLIIVGSACSKGANQRPSVDSGTSSAAVSSPADSATARDGGKTPDTMANHERSNGSNRSTPASRPDSSGHAETSAPAKPAPAKPPVKPNIDPGRLTPKPRTAAAPESGASAPQSSTSPTRDSSSAPASQPAASGQQDQLLKYDAASNTVTFQLIAGPNGFQFNGYSNGGATLTLPSKANAVINFVNKDGTPHSAEVISGEGPIPNAGGDPGIPRAYTNQLSQGLPQEATDEMRFTVPDSGKYRIFCGVPGHGLSGMWIWMVVDPAAKTPSFGPTKS
jgi:plastocyanin